MADIKVSQMTEASSAGDNDYLMIVQGGASKKIKASKFVRAGEQVSDALTLDGHTPDEFLGATDTAADSNKLGGHPASDFARTSDIPALSDPTGCTMKLWYKNIEDTEHDDSVSQSLRALNYVVCDGRLLSKTEYSELHAIIGESYMTATDIEAYPTKFRIPDMRARFPLGANMVGIGTESPGFSEIKTQNLPPDVYSGADIKSDHQFYFPKTVGSKGGDPTVVQTDQRQMALHDHPITKRPNGWASDLNGNVSSVQKNGDAYGFEKDPASAGITTTGNKGVNRAENFSTYPIFGNYDAETNYAYGMLAMPPYLTFCFIMKVKP